MRDTPALAASCDELARRLEGQPTIDEVKAVYLELSVLLGQIQGAVHEAARRRAPDAALSGPEESFERFKRSARQVGLDIRLASPAALQVGLQTALAYARETLRRLEAETG